MLGSLICRFRGFESNKGKLPLFGLPTVSEITKLVFESTTVDSQAKNGGLSGGII